MSTRNAEFTRRKREADRKARAALLLAQIHAARKVKALLVALKSDVRNAIAASGILDPGTVTTRREIEGLVRSLNRLFVRFHGQTLTLATDTLEKVAAIPAARAKAIGETVLDLLPAEFRKQAPDLLAVVLGKLEAGDLPRSLAIRAVRGDLAAIRAGQITLSDRLWRANQKALRQVEALLNVARTERWDMVKASKALENLLVPNAPASLKSGGPIWSARRTEAGLRRQLADVIGHDPTDAVLSKVGGRLAITDTLTGTRIISAPDRLRGIISGARIEGRSPQNTVSYNYFRIVRTEMAKMFREADLVMYGRMREAGIKTNVKWTLSASHPALDVCDTLASQDVYGLGSGVYPPSGVPALPHPNCGCYTVADFDFEATMRDLEAQVRGAGRGVKSAIGELELIAA